MHLRKGRISHKFLILCFVILGSWGAQARTPVEDIARQDLLDPAFWRGREHRMIYDPESKHIFWFDKSL